MGKVKLIGIAPCYNELSKGHLERFFINIPKIVDGLVILDDASTDGSYEYVKDHTEHVLRNKINRFIFEQDNTQVLINEALRCYPDLTHILTLNIDSSFSPSCFKEGDAILHKCLEEHPEHGMWVGRNVHLWRSNFWYRSDRGWKDDSTERVYVRAHSLSMVHAKRKGLHHGKVTTASNWSSINEYYPEFASLHWGFSEKKLIEEKFHFYLTQERQRIPSPDKYYCTNVFKLLDEFDLKLDKVDEKWFDPDIKYSKEKRKPLPISYYSHIQIYDKQKANEYKTYFTEKCGFHSEEETYKEIV